MYENNVYAGAKLSYQAIPVPFENKDIIRKQLIQKLHNQIDDAPISARRKQINK